METELSATIKEIFRKREFLKYILIYIVLLIGLELFFGLFLFSYFTKKVEDERRDEFRIAWEHYLSQRWQIHSKSSKVTGYAWELIEKKKYPEVRNLFQNDPSILKESDYFAIFLPEGKILLEMNSKEKQEIFFTDRKIFDQIFRIRSGQAGQDNYILPVKGNVFYLVSVAPLSDYHGKPKIPGIQIIAIELQKFLDLSSEVIQGKFSIVRDVAPERISELIDLQGYNPFSRAPLFISVAPKRSVGSFVKFFFSLFLLIQITVSISVLVYIIPKFSRRQTDNLRSMLSESDKINHELSERLDELTRARIAIQNSERKYKQLIENSSDIYFSLDEDMNILMVNKRIKDHLGLKPQDVIGRPFFDLVYVAPMQRGTLEKLFVLEKFEEMKEQKSGTTLKVNFYTNHKEPKELDVQLEYIETEADFAIFGKASPMIEDSILLYCQSERKKYIIGNFINLADQVSNRVTMNIHKYLNPETVLSIKICLREIIINAIEHGNLNIAYDEKTKMKESGNYFKFLAERQNNPEYKFKKVTIDYSLRPDKVTFMITDEGKGFDYKKIRERALDANAQSLSHGRGIIMTLNTFDVVKYNDIGNEVFLSKTLTGPIS